MKTFVTLLAIVVVIALIIGENGSDAQYRGGRGRGGYGRGSDQDYDAIPASHYGRHQRHEGYGRQRGHDYDDDEDEEPHRRSAPRRRHDIHSYRFGGRGR